MGMLSREARGPRRGLSNFGVAAPLYPSCDRVMPSAERVHLWVTRRSDREASPELTAPGPSRHVRPMTSGAGGWACTVTVPVGRRYPVPVSVDGERWENDWAADDYVDNDHGGQDSVVDLTAGTLD